MPKVSVLVPVFNAERYLRECIESILRQSLTDLEIICVNDGSTDGSLSILREYQAADPRIQIIDQKNGGYGRAINAGFQAAKGEYIGIVEADDYIAPQMYETLWKTAHRGSLDAVKGDYAYFRENGTSGQRVFDRVMVCPYLSWYYRKLAPDRMPRLLEADMMNVTGIYRREFLQQNQIRLRETPGASFQDTGLWFQIFSQAESCKFLPYSFYYIRRDNPDSSVMDPEKLYMICEEYDAICTGLNISTPEGQRFAAYLFRRRVSAYQFILSKTPEEEREKILIRLSKDIAHARQTGAYCQRLFTSTMNRFLEQVERWDGSGGFPALAASGSLWRRAVDCLREHGVTYTIRRVRIKLGIQEEIF